MSKTIICTATDDGYAEMALELIASIRDFPQGREVAIGTIDLGERPRRARGRTRRLGD
jgi:hypothetical protein